MSTLLLHSVSYAGFWGQPALTVEQIIDKAKELGFGGVMLAAKRPHVSILDYNEAARTKLRRLLEKKKLKNLCLANNSFSRRGLLRLRQNFPRLGCDRGERAQHGSRPRGGGGRPAISAPAAPPAH